jgi:hypothetical protein
MASIVVGETQTEAEVENPAMPSGQNLNAKSIQIRCKKTGRINPHAKRIRQEHHSIVGKPNASINAGQSRSSADFPSMFSHLHQ